MLVLILLYFIFGILSLPVFNMSLKKLLIEMLHGEGKELTFTLWLLTSFLPFFLLFVIAIIFPDIIQVFNIFGLTIWTLNGYVYACLF